MSDSRSLTAFVDAGIYTRLECGCIMYAVEIDPCGPRLCLVENAGHCELPHTVEDFMPLQITAAQALYAAGIA